MAQIIIDLSDDAKALAEKHAKELGYPDAADWAFELIRNFAAQREDANYQRMHAGEHNHVFGRSKREVADHQRRVAAEALEVKKRAAAAARRKKGAKR